MVVFFQSRAARQVWISEARFHRSIQGWRSFSLIVMMIVSSSGGESAPLYLDICNLYLLLSTLVWSCAYRACLWGISVSTTTATFEAGISWGREFVQFFAAWRRLARETTSPVGFAAAFIDGALASFYLLILVLFATTHKALHSIESYEKSKG